MDTPSRSAITAMLAPRVRSVSTSVRSAGVNFDGPLGPGRRRIKAAGPSASAERRHRHNDTVLVENAAATATSVTSGSLDAPTAANRRNTSSPRSQQYAANPLTSTIPPSGPSSTATDGEICTALGGATGSAVCSPSTDIHPPSTANIVTLINSHDLVEGNTTRPKTADQTGYRQSTRRAMSGALVLSRGIEGSHAVKGFLCGFLGLTSCYLRL